MSFFPKISLQSSKEEESSDENPTLGKKRKIRTTTARNKRQRLEALTRTLPIKVYPNHLQKQLLKRWMGLSRYAYNAVVRWSRHRRVYTKHSGVSPSPSTTHLYLIEKLKRPSEVRNLINKYTQDQPKIVYIKIKPLYGPSTIYYDNNTAVIYHDNGKPIESLISSLASSVASPHPSTVENEPNINERIDDLTNSSKPNIRTFNKIPSIIDETTINETMNNLSIRMDKISTN